MIIYSKYNLHREKEFQLLTTIEREDGSLFSAKVSRQKESKKFLNSFFWKYERILSADFSMVPVKPQKINDAKIRFDYIEGSSLENLLLASLISKDKNGFLEIVKSYVELIKKNKISKQSLSEEFKKIFGEYQGEDMECLELGCLDLNLDNIKYNREDKTYQLLDYEWMFDFPIPYKYIIFRSLIDFYYKNRNYKPHELLSLGILFDHVGIKDKEIFSCFEYNFQKYVLGINFQHSLKTYKEWIISIENGQYLLKNRTFIDFAELIQRKDIEFNRLNKIIQQKESKIQQRDQAIQQRDQAIQQKDSDLQQKDQVIQQKDSEIQQKEKIVKDRNAEIKLMKSSKFWKMREKYLRLKNIFSRKKNGK